MQFVGWSRASKDSPVLLLLDGHHTYTHTRTCARTSMHTHTHPKNVTVIDYTRENGVIILCFPPHFTHRLQPRCKLHEIFKCI